MSAVHQLSREDLITILTEPRNALVKQFQRFFSFDGIELVFSDDALVSIAEKALERETGARGLRSIIEETLLDVQFELPSRRDVKKCVVTKETIEKGLTPTLVTEAARRRAAEDQHGRVGLGAGPRARPDPRPCRAVGDPARAGVTVRDAWMKLTPGERAHLTNLVKKSQGRPGNLSARERADVKRLVRKMEPAALGRSLAPLGRKARKLRRRDQPGRRATIRRYSAS